LEQYRVSTFLFSKFVWLGACYRPDEILATKAQIEITFLSSIPFWLQGNSHFPCSLITVFNYRFRFLHRTHYL